MGITSIITVNFNQPAVTVELLKSIRQHIDSEQVEVVVVDNGCREDHSDLFIDAYPGVIYVSSVKNLGFAGGNNLGVKHATGDYFLFLNNDTEVTAGLITNLTSVLETNPNAGMVSPLILYYDQPDIIQYAGFTKMNYLTCRNRNIAHLDVDSGQFDKITTETGYCHGAAMMCRKADVQSIGMMAENYFLYYEELDWCEQFIRAGKSIYFTGTAKIYHKESISVGKESVIKTYFMTRNRLLFIRRNTGFINTMIFCIYYLSVACPRQVLKYIFNQRKDLVKWVFKGIIWNISHDKNSLDLGFKL